MKLEVNSRRPLGWNRGCGLAFSLLACASGKPEYQKSADGGGGFFRSPVLAEGRDIPTLLGFE